MAAQEFHTPPLPQEILLMIMKQVDHGERYSAAKNSLRSAILVNHAWAEAGTDILWRDPPVGALASVSPGRRQYYANKVTEFYFDGKEEGTHHATFKGLRFPRLRTILVDTVKLKKRQKLHLKQYMGPRLQNFHYYGGHRCENALTELETNCPRLEEIQLEEPIDDSDQDQLMDFIRNCKSLEVVDLGDGWEGVITAQVFTALANHERLGKLQLRPFLANSDVQIGLQMSSTPFHSLQSLHLHVDSRSVARLTAVVPNINALFLSVECSDHEVLTPIGSLTRLIHLEVIFFEATELSREGVRALGQLNRLESLLIEPRNEPLSAMWLDDEEFIRITSKLPKLSSFTFKVDCDITLSALTFLGTTHNRIQNCDVFGTYDLDDWARMTTPVFPQLVRFAIDAPDLQGRTRRAASASLSARAGHIADIILRHAPRVEQLSFHAYNEDMLAELVLRAFEARVGGRFSRFLATSFRSSLWMDEHSPLIVFRPSETQIVHED